MATEPPQQAERAALCDLFLKVGPDAPTLCEGWTTYDLAAHLVIRERKPLSGPGLVMGGAAARLTARILTRTKERRSYPELVATVRRGPPALLAPFDRVMNLTEYFVHHEDVRRGGGDTTPRRGPEAAQIEGALWQSLHRSAKFMTRSAKTTAIDLVRPDGEVIHARTGTSVATITGSAGGDRPVSLGPERRRPRRGGWSSRRGGSGAGRRIRDLRRGHGPEAEARACADLGCDAEVDRTEASIAPARGGDRTPDTRALDPRGRGPGPAGATALRSTVKALFLGTFLLSLLPVAFAPPASATPGRHVDRLTLERQSPWVGPNPPNQDLTMGLRIRSGAPTSALRLSFTVFRPVSTRSGFDETLSRPRPRLGDRPVPGHRPFSLQHRRPGRHRGDHSRRRGHHPDRDR